MTIWFDMDGTIADLYSVEGWLDFLRNDSTVPYEQAKPMFNFSRFARYLNLLQKKGYTIGIISWGSKFASEEYLTRIRAEKFFWLMKHLPSVSWDYIKVEHYGTNKWEACGEGILFDDEIKNRDNWQGEAYSPETIFDILMNLNRKEV